jgi:hypothetical protein
MRTILLGPQRFQTTATTALRSLGVEGPVATINSGWEEREDDVAELDTALDGRAVHLRLHHRMLDVIAKDPVFSASALAFRDRHDDLLSAYRLRLHHALDGVYAVQRRSQSHPTFGGVDDSIEMLRGVDRWYFAQLRSLYEELGTVAPLESSGVIGWHRGEIQAILAGSAALVLTGGHVGTLLRTLRLFAIEIPDILPVIAWSAGAMALTERIVLFHDDGPEGASETEVFDWGLGRVKGFVAFPHARRRLRLDDRARCAVLARRFGERHCVLLDDGVVLELDGSGALPAGARILGIDGVVHEVLPR